MSPSVDRIGASGGYSGLGEMRIAYTILVWKLLGRARGWEDNIKMDLRKQVGKWTVLAQNRV
jgi:hypothetical protein